MLVGESSRSAEFFQSTEFIATDHRLLVALLKLHVKSRKPPRCNHTMFHLEKLKDLTCAQEYAVTVSNRFRALDTLQNPEELWYTFKRETFETAKKCIGEGPRSLSGFTLVDTLESIEESRTARLAGDHNQYRALSHRTRTPMRRDKERYSMAGVSLRMSSVI